ncbi:MAG: hypothetical protein Q7T21_02370 [Gallionella sp.]|nr:hypothetical protein [Gallionella sp.]
MNTDPIAEFKSKNMVDSNSKCTTGAFDCAKGMKGTRLMEFTCKGAVAPILTLLSLTLLAGCGVGDPASPSNLYPTSSIYAYMKAVQIESGNVTTTVQLRDGPASTAAYLYLSDGESLYTSLDKPPQQYINFNGDLFGNSLELSQHLKVMSARDLYTDFYLFTQVVFGKPEYFSLDTPSTSSSPVRAYVDFERTGHVMTGESSVELPPAFQITAPAGEASVSRATPLVLTWTGVDPATTMKLDVAGVCADGSPYTLNLILGTDTGSATLNSADYFPATGTSPSTNCRVAFLLQRVRLGGVSSQFAFGSFSEGVQQRTIQFTSTP